jgi:type IV pilus assembly protein PilB
VADQIDAAFLAEVRRLRSFLQNCDLNSLAANATGPLDLLERLVASGQLQKDEAGTLWSRRLGVAYVNPFDLAITEEAVELLPAEIAEKAQALPVYRIGQTLSVAMADPSDAQLVDRLSKIVRLPVSPLFAFPADVRDMLRIHYTSEDSLDQAVRSVEGLETLSSGGDLAAGGAELASLARSDEVISFINSLVYFAIQREASDIHIEPREKESQVRFRIDGDLYAVLSFPLKVNAAVITRLKIMAALDIADRRMPADGRFSLPLGAGQADFRFSSIPTQYGEKAVVRLLAGTGKKSLLSLDKMMISQTILQPFRRVLHNPSGIIFVVGPTGSGKTTTLYAALAELNQPDVNISTIEDPIEVRLAGITQTQINAKIDLSFARMLRSLLRQDPDIMLVGEIRDLETAKIATEAALTGHLVLATLHTNTAPEAIVRLSEMGVDPYLIAPTVLAVLSQRLARRICENCKESYVPSDETLRKYFDDDTLPEVTFYRGRGCHVCNRTGYKGRVSFHEMLLINRRLRTAISERASQTELTDLAARMGYRPLRYDGLKKVLLGLTTVEEIEAQTPVEFEG